MVRQELNFFFLNGTLQLVSRKMCIGS